MTGLTVPLKMPKMSFSQDIIIPDAYVVLVFNL